MIKTTSKKNIIILGTGGTIAGVGLAGKTGSYCPAQVKIDSLVSGVPQVEDIANIKSKEFCSIDSCDMNFKRWIELANYINTEAQRDDVDGFVITHGTDTLEETAYFLNLTIKTHKSVVLTGAMRPSTAMSADGPFNLFQAVALAKSIEAAGKGVLVAFSDGIYGARDVYKANTFKTDAFSQKDFGCLGYMRDDEVYFYNSTLKKHTVNSEFDLSALEKRVPKVEIVMFYSGADVNILRKAAENSDGVIIAGAGCGGSNCEWDDEVEKILKKGTLIVRSSRVVNGLVSGTNEKCGKTGIYSDTLSPQKARILLTLALTKTKDLREIQSMFNEY